MANPFDQFDVQTKAGNPFDQFDSPTVPKERTPEAGFSVGDIGVAGVRGALGVTKAITDVFGADNPVSKKLAEYSTSMASLYTPERQKEIAFYERKAKEAEESGKPTEEIKTALQSIKAAPLQATAEAVGSIIPNLASLFIPVVGEARGAAMARSAYNMFIGIMEGTGAVKGSIYDNVKEELVKNKVPEEQAAKIAEQAQSYTGKNFDMIMAGAGIGAAAGYLGVERLLSPGMNKLKQKALSVGSEMFTEAGQATQEQIAANLAARREGLDVDLMKGVAGAATREGVMGALGAGTVGAISPTAPPEKPPEEPTTQPAVEPTPVQAAPVTPAAPPVEAIAPPAEPPPAQPMPEPPEDVTKAMENYWQGRPEDFGMSFIDIQNRDRTKPASIQQMMSIARQPDYNRLSVSRDFGAGAPVVISDVELDKNRLGRVDVVSASDGTKIPVQYAVLDAREVTPSNRADGTTVDQYGDPAFEGIRPVAGNGRIAGLQELYRSGPYGDYVNAMLQDPAHGITPSVIDAIEQPVLVRIMPKSSLTPDIADKSNVGGQLGMSPTEQAKIDMGRFDLQGIDFLTDGSPTIASLRQFVAAMPKEEQAQLMNRQGQPTPLAQTRLANALFARAYENDALIDLYAETTDPEALQILRGMAIAAPAMSNLQNAGDYDVRNYVTKAAELAVNARRQGKDLGEYIDQGDIEMDPLTREVVSMFAANKNAPRRIGDSLIELAAEANKAAAQATAEPDMFGNVAVAIPLENVFGVLRTEPKAPTKTKPTEEPPTPPDQQTYKINKSVQQIAQEIDGMSIMQVADWLISNAPNSFARTVATAIKSRIKVMQDRKIPMTFRVLKGAERSKRNVGSVSYPKERENTFKLELNGPNVPGQKNQILETNVGTNYRTMLHEMLHLATSGQINVSIRSGESKTGPVGELQKLLTFLRKKVKEDQAAGIPVPPRLNTKRGLQNIKELLAYGLTEIEIQQYLSGVTYKKTNGYTKFVEIIRKLLGLNQSTQSSLERLVALSEEILTTPEQEVARVYQAAGVPFGAGVGDAETVSDLEAEEPTTPAQKAKAAAQKALQKRTLKKSQFDGVPDDLYSALEPIFAPEKKTIIDKIDGMRDGFFMKLAQGIADQYRSIKDISQEAYMKARMSKTIDGALEGILFNGQVKLTDGALDIAPNTKGLLKVLEPVGNEVDRYQIWVALQRDAQLVAQGKAPSVDRDVVARRNELSAGKIGNKSRLEVYKQVQKDMNELNRSVLRIAFKQGIIDKEAFKVYSRDINYIPFYKMLDENSDVQAAATKSGLINQYFSKELKGGEKPFGDLMENTLRNWSHILSASMKNEAANATVRAAMDLGGAFPNLKVGLEWRDGKVYSSKSGEMIGDGKLKPEYTTSGKGMIKTMIDGKPAYFDIADPMLLESIMSIGYMGPKSKFLDIARDFKNMLQFGVTLSPAFKIRNLFRDSISAIAVTDLKRNPFANVIQGWAESDRNNPAHISALAGGAIFNFGSAYEGDQAKLIKRLLDSGIKGDRILDNEKKIEAGLREAWRAYQDFGNKSESANRMALYKQLRETVNPETKKNYTHLEASFYARDMLDFSMQGAWPAFRLVTQVVPFLNARVQGLYKLGRDGIIPTSRVIYNTVTGKPIEVTDKQRAEQFSIVMGAVVLASLMLYMAFKDDEEFKKREQWDRDNFWWFRLPGMDSAIRVPKPFEIGAMGTLAERTLEQIIDQGAEGKVFGQSLSRMLTDTFAINPIPQVIKPLVDLYANKDSFTGAPIETAGMERLSKAERIAERTSPLAIGLSKVANVFLPEATEVSPVQVDYAIKGYLGWLGGTISATSHYAVMPFSKSAYPDANWTETMSMGFIKTLPATQSKYVTAFYENNKEISQAYADMRHFAQLGQADKVQEIIAEKGDKIAMAKFYDNASKDMAKMRQAIQAIRNDENMTGAQKKEEIDRMKVLIGEVAKQMEEARIEVKKTYAAAR